MNRLLALPLLLLLAVPRPAGPAHLGPAPEQRTHPPPFLDRPTPWADSLFATLSLEGRIAQLMMVAAYSNKDAAHEAAIEKLVRDHHIGGLIFFQGGPVRQARLTDRYQEAARVPLLLGMDLEWGLAMRLDSTIRYPRQMTLGALRDASLVEEMGADIARQMRRLGVHVSFSPVVDVNNNAANPVINDRSFGEQRENVALKGIAYMRGLQREGIIATAKHFPGHGDTDSDSHHTLPTVAHARPRLDSLELWPFQRLTDAGVAAMMVAHLEVPALDSTPGLPSTLSRPIVQDLLQGTLGFRGLVFTDALNMRGVADAEKPGEIELRALLAGNDVMLFPQDPVKAIRRILLAVKEGEVDSARIDHSCLKILRAKEWVGLHQRRPIRMEGLVEELNDARSLALRRRLHAGALTVLNDHNKVLPIRPNDSLRVASLAIGGTAENSFQRSLGRLSEVTSFHCGKSLNPAAQTRLLEKLAPFDRVIVSVHGTTWRPGRDFGIPDSAMEIVRAIAARKPTVFVLFANPYRLTRAYGAQFLASVLVAYEETEDSQDLAAQAIFGAIAATGKLPVTPSSFYRAGDGTSTRALGILTRGMPEEVGVRSSDLLAIDSIVQEGLDAKAFPGAQVLVAVDGHVIFDRNYGHHRYDRARAVRADDLYDLASITKVAATTLAMMRLVDEGLIDLDARLGSYLPELDTSHPTHARMLLRDILTHQAGLKSWSPFYLRLLAKDGSYRPGVVSTTASATHPVRVSEGVFIQEASADSIMQWVLDTPLGKAGDYLYSDMGYYLLQAAIERVTDMPMDQWLEARFYGPLQLQTLGYLPREGFPLERIVPTEDDRVFRKGLVHGDVHDPGAAMRGGVAGHAGLFSNAHDLAVLMQLLLNGGTYGGKRYLSEGVIREFTRCQFCKPDGSGNRRALGFDRRTFNGNGKGPTCECVSYASFGHTGFTGTMAWADPESRVVYIFLSNRVHPSAEKNKLAELNIRTRIQEVVHSAVAARDRPQSMAQPMPDR